jgi:5'-deoxynucleotidase YfbR-like HD superfamily hydrolase
MSQPIVEIFFSYALEDEDLRNKLVKHLSLLERQGVIKAWHDRNITAGEEWKNAINSHLESANIILLLVSADFLASDYCYDIELKRALERHESNEARVIPVILRSVDWHGSTFGKLAALPSDSKAITSWENEDEAFTDVVQGLSRVIKKVEKLKAFVEGESSSSTSSEKLRHEEILEEFDLEDVLDILRNLVKHPTTEKSYLTVLTNSCADNVNDKSMSFAVRGEIGTGKSLVAESTYFYLHTLWKNGKTKYKPYLSNLLWDIEKKNSLNNLGLTDEDLIEAEKKIINDIFNCNEDKIFIIIDGLDRYNRFSVKLLHELTIIASCFTACNLLFFERIYSPRHNFEEATTDERIVGVEKYLHDMFFIDFVRTNKNKLSRILAKKFSAIDSTQFELVEKSLEETQKWYSKLNSLRLVHLYISKSESAHNSFLLLNDFVRKYINKNLKTDIEVALKNSERYAYKLLFCNSKDNKDIINQLIPVDTKDVFSKRIATQSIPMLFYLSSSYLLRSLFLQEDGFSQENINNFEHIFTSFFTQYVKSIIKNNKQYDERNIISLVEQNYSRCGIELKSFLMYLCGRFETGEAKKRARKFIVKEINNLKNTDKENTNISDQLMLERTLHVSLIYLGGESNNYIEKLMSDPLNDSINRWFHLVYYGDINYFDERNNYFKDKDINLDDSSGISFKNTYDELVQNITSARSNKRHINDLAIYTLYSLALNRHQYKCLNETVDNINDLKILAEEHISNSKFVDPSIKEYVANCLQYLDSSESPFLQSFFWILKLKVHRRNGWNNDNKDFGSIRKVKDPESILAHIGSATLLAQIILPEKIEKVKSSKNNEKAQYDEYDKYDKNEIIKLLLIHDIGEYDKGDIPKPRQSSRDRDDEATAVKRLKIIPLPTNEINDSNSQRWSNLPNPQDTIWKYWDAFENTHDNINVKIARDIDSLECMIQLENYSRDSSNNSIPDFNDFKSSLKKEIQTEIIRVIGKAILGELF